MPSETQGMSESATSAIRNDITTSCDTLRQLFSSFPYRHCEARGKPETQDKTCWSLKTSILCETSANFDTLTRDHLQKSKPLRYATTDDIWPTAPRYATKPWWNTPGHLKHKAFHKVMPYITILALVLVACVHDSPNFDVEPLEMDKHQWRRQRGPRRQRRPRLCRHCCHRRARHRHRKHPPLPPEQSLRATIHLLNLNLCPRWHRGGWTRRSSPWPTSSGNTFSRTACHRS